jgi:hypothetical protein
VADGIICDLFSSKEAKLAIEQAMKVRGAFPSIVLLFLYPRR